MRLSTVTWILLTALAGCREPGPAPGPSDAPEPGHRRHVSLSSTCEDPVLLPDLLVFASNHDSRGFDLYARHLSSQEITRVTRDAADEREPAISPDAGTLAFATNARGTWDIVSAPLSSAADAGWTPIATTEDDETHPTWAPDGVRIAWCAFDRNTHEWKLRARDAAGMILELGEGFAPEWHPSRDLLVCQHGRLAGDGLWTLEIVDVPSGHTREIAPVPGEGAVTPSWSPDGNWILYASVNASSQEPLDLWAVSINGSRRVRLTSSPASEWNPRFGPDGRIYYCRKVGDSSEIWSMESPL